MAAGITEPGFIVWGADQTAYGPVELPTLISWVKAERVTAETWVYATHQSVWQKALEFPELQLFLRSRDSSSLPPRVDGLNPRALRRVKILAYMSDEQLAQFAGYVQVERAPQWAVVVRQGAPGDAMFLILDGEVRVRMNIMGKETTLATLGAGEFFGDISLFDQGPRSADVVANVDSTIVRITSGSFSKLAKEAPDLATPFLLAIGRTLTARIRADNKRWGDSVKFSHAAI